MKVTGATGVSCVGSCGALTGCGDIDRGEPTASVTCLRVTAVKTVVKNTTSETRFVHLNCEDVALQLQLGQTLKCSIGYKDAFCIPT